jgi:signal transduction histidine kinase
VRRHLTARLRLTLINTSLFAACGAVLVLITYLLLSHNLPRTVTTNRTADVQAQIEQCMRSATVKGAVGAYPKQKCAALFANGVKAGASAQRSTALEHLLLYSLLTLAGVTALAALLAWLWAGRVLRPVKQLTAAARGASERNLSQRLALGGPRDELRELADTFDDMLDRLERAFTSQQSFIANASHELRTPLTVMRTALDVVLAKPQPTNEEVRSMATDVQNAITQTERLIDALLTLARTEHANAISDPLDLAVIAENVVEENAAAGVTTIASLTSAPVIGDEVLLERLIGNLLENAARYNIPDGTVAVSTANDDGTSILRVVNTGPVVAPNDVDRLFLPFTRLEDRTRHDGFGLGLALVSSIAALHRATVAADAVPTGGLDIRVVFPRAP